MTIPPLGYQPLSLPSLQPPAAPVAPTAPGSGTAGTNGTNGAAGIAGAAGTAQGAATGGFGGALTSALGALNGSQLQADQAAQTLAAGGGNIAGAMIATEKASLQMQFAFAVRNKAINAYQQIMAMQL